VIDSGKSNGIRRRAGLALILGAGLALGACSTMADMGEATADGASKVADAMNPFNWFGSKDSGDAQQQDSETDQRAKQGRSVAATATKTGMKSAPHDALTEQMATADEGRYPKLSSVPDRPKAEMTKRAAKERQELRDGLAADEANAHYTDQTLRAETTLPSAPQPTDRARSDDRVAGETQPTPAPTTPVASAPAAPLPAASPPVRTAAITPPSVPRVAPLPTTRARAPLAAASAAPVAPVAAPTRPVPAPRPQQQASLSQPAPASPASQPLQSVLKTVQVATIYFNDGSTRLSDHDRKLIDEVAELARKTGGTLRIIGHASMGKPKRDPERADLANYKVSLDRANSVATELARNGVPGTKMQVMAEGARNPIYAESSATGAAGNRRAEIFLDYYEKL